MMKNEDLKKHSKEEKLVLRPDRTLYNTTLILILFYSNLFAQIPLNGFCRYQEFQTKSGYSQIFPLDYNGDGWRDLLLFNDTEKRYSLQSWDKSQYSRPIEKIFTSTLYALHSFGADETQGRKYIYLSRKQRELGLVLFSKNGSVSIQSKINLKSFPSSIDVSDIDGDGKLEILLSGGSFHGLSIIREIKRKFIEANINPRNTFYYSSFIDLDYDGRADIAAIDLFTNSIMLFYNDGTGNFREWRSIGLSEQIHEFKSVDVNSDDFTDLAYIKNNRFEVLLGDSVSSFQQKLFINCEVKPDRYTILDFNGDGYNDIAFLNNETGSLYIAFAKSTTDFYPPILYLKRQGIIDLCSFIDRGGRKLCVLDKNGKLYLINKVSANDEEFSIALGAKPTLVGNFNSTNDRINDFYFIEDEKKSLCVLISSKRKMFDKYYTYPLSGAYTNAVIDETHPKKRTFYFYSAGQRIIELVHADFFEENFTRRVLYSDAPIEDLKLTSDRLKDHQSILVLVNKKGKLLLQTFEFKDFRYMSSGLDSIAVNVSAASLALGVNKEIYYFSKYGGGLYLNKSIFNKRAQSAVNISSFQIDPNINIKYEVNNYNYGNVIEKPIVAWISKGSDTDLLVLNKGHYISLTLRRFSPVEGLTRYLFKEGQNYLYMYDKSLGVIKVVIFNNFSQNHFIRDIFESKNINSYIVATLNDEKEYFIYSDVKDNLLKFKYIK